MKTGKFVGPMKFRVFSTDSADGIWESFRWFPIFFSKISEAMAFNLKTT